MARPTDQPSASQFRTQAYITSWWANNAYYAPTAGYNYAYSPSNIYTDAAIRSGVVHTGGYTLLTPMQQGIGVSPYTMANPRNSASQAKYDQFGNVKRQKGDVQLGLVLMGGYQFPGQAFMPVRGKDGRFEPNALVKWMTSLGAEGPTLPMLRNRRSSVGERVSGWAGILSESTGSNKAMSVPGAAGRGQSSEDSTQEMYSTEETRIGTRAQFTDEEWQEDKGKVGRSWAGFRALGSTGSTPHLDAELGQMYERTNPNVGFARRRGL